MEAQSKEKVAQRLTQALMETVKLEEPSGSGCQ